MSVYSDAMSSRAAEATSDFDLSRLFPVEVPCLPFSAVRMYISSLGRTDYFYKVSAMDIYISPNFEDLIFTGPTDLLCSFSDSIYKDMAWVYAASLPTCSFPMFMA